METIGFIGLGTMGRLMCANLMKNGYTAIVHDIVPAAVAELAAKGATAAADAASVGREADIVFLMLMNYRQIADIALGENGLLAAMRPGGIVVVHSTIAPSEVARLTDEAVKQNIGVVDAPVSGSRERAADGTLVIMAACPDDAFERVKPILRVVGSNLVRVGDRAGLGQMVKAINQILVSVHTAVTGEVLTLAQKAGLDLPLLCEVISKSMGQSKIFEAKAMQLVKRDFEARGALKLNVKDMGIGLRMGKELGAPLYLTALTRELFNAAAVKGYGDEDLCAVAKIYEDGAKCRIGG